MTSTAGDLRRLERDLEGEPENSEFRLRLTHEYLRTKTGLLFFWSMRSYSMLHLGAHPPPPHPPAPRVLSPWAVPMTLDHYMTGGDVSITALGFDTPSAANPNPTYRIGGFEAPSATHPNPTYRKFGYGTAALRSELDVLQPRLLRIIHDGLFERTRFTGSGHVIQRDRTPEGHGWEDPHLVICLASGKHTIPPRGLVSTSTSAPLVVTSCDPITTPGYGFGL